MNAFFFSNITFLKKTTFGKAQDKARAFSKSPGFSRLFQIYGLFANPAPSWLRDPPRWLFKALPAVSEAFPTP